jgi:hypothetical protein
MNRERVNAMRQLDREINGYLKFDTKDIAKQMNNAFEGKKEAFSYTSKVAKADHSINTKSNDKDKRMQAILAEAASMGTNKELGPILEETATSGGNEMVLYKPNMTLSDQRKLKNEELKKKVKMITQSEKLETESNSSDK